MVYRFNESLSPSRLNCTFPVNIPVEHPIRIAVALACFNRREVTLTSLRLLFAQQLPKNAEVTAFLLDAGSSDGTAEGVRSEFPQVRLLRGDSNLFWNAGMRVAYGEALRQDFDHYIWLNDDTHLYPDAVSRLLVTYHDLIAQGKQSPIITGCTQDPESHVLTYGGVVRSSPFYPFRYRHVVPGEKALPCHTINGNIVLIPREAATRTGNLSKAFTHSMGDHDYGLRARKVGCSLWVAPGYMGTCSRNDIMGTWQDETLAFRERWRKLNGPKGMPPREYLSYTRVHGGPLWVLLWLYPYVRAITLFALRRRA
jgi:GT2 family glycosyltransferase